MSETVAAVEFRKRHAKVVYPFWYGGAASIVAGITTHPLDLAKARMQAAKLPGQTMVSTLVRTIKQEGFFGIYDGLSASILRQATYSTARFGTYEKLKDWASGGSTKVPPVYVLLPCSMVAGLVGSIIGNPADLANVRMQNDRTLPLDQRRGYRNAVDAVVRIFKEEGASGLFRGAGPNGLRGVLMTASQVVSYDTGKSALVQQCGLDPTSRITFFLASIWAGFVATTVCSPVDVIKTRAMNSSEKMGMIATLRSSVKKEGPSFMFRGWTPAFIRLAPQTIVTFIVMEQLRKWSPGARTIWVHES